MIKKNTTIHIICIFMLMQIFILCCYNNNVFAQSSSSYSIEYDGSKTNAFNLKEIQNLCASSTLSGNNLSFCKIVTFCNNHCTDIDNISNNKLKQLCSVCGHEDRIIYNLCNERDANNNLINKELNICKKTMSIGGTIKTNFDINSLHSLTEGFLCIKKTTNLSTSVVNNNGNLESEIIVENCFPVLYPKPYNISPTTKTIIVNGIHTVYINYSDCIDDCITLTSN